MEKKSEVYISTSKLAKLINYSSPELFTKLNLNKWIIKEDKNWLLLEKGKKAGGTYGGNDKGEQWIIWNSSIVKNKDFKREILGEEITLVQRKFKLPGIDDLNKSQDRVLRLPEDGQFLVVGGPGTGKSVVALLRTMKYHKKEDYAFLTFNKVLLSATKQLVNFDLNSFTLDSWLRKEYCTLFENYCKEYAYKTPPELHYNTRDYDKVINSLEKKNIQEQTLKIIVDEGQDKPAKYYEALMCLGIENFFIVADQNQQITEENSSRQELTDLLGLDVDEVIELTENFRNSHSIGLFAEYFFTDPSSPKPQLPSASKPSLGTPTLFEYTHYESCVKLILREADRDNRNLIGVVVANEGIRDSYVKSLESVDLNLDNPRPIISTYSSKDKQNPNINFGYGGVVVLNDKAIKGLEFDIVFIIIDGFKIYNNDIDSIKKRFYVMSSRAIKKLVLFKSNKYSGGVDKILPSDKEILKREILPNG